MIGRSFCGLVWLACCLRDFSLLYGNLRAGTELASCQQGFQDLAEGCAPMFLILLWVND